jgi:hypothetical protein
LRDRWVDETIRHILEQKMGGEAVFKPYREDAARINEDMGDEVVTGVIPEGTPNFPYYPPEWSDILRSFSIPPSKRLRGHLER